VREIQEVEAIIAPVYLVGGSVRDMFLGRTPKDYDFCTPLLPEEIEKRVKDAGKRAFTTGKRFGTIGFKVDKDFVEVTTFRNEVYTGSRKPTVEFVKTITEDLGRRDFTMNAIALRGSKKIDPFRRERDITDNKVLPHPTWVAECKEHGAMNCVNPERTIWRCLTCNVGAYRAVVFGEKE
jgi:tRNA nucleotidyltransferase/poly(A) polymerase